jgi:hypothetical protein
MIKTSCTLLFLLFASSLAHAQDFQPGRYYTRKGKRVEGYISNPPTYYKKSYIQFKANLNDPAPKEIPAAELNGFVMGADTFAILRRFKAEGVMEPYILVATGIARVLEVGKVIIYEHTYFEKISIEGHQLGTFDRPASPIPMGKEKYVTTNYLLQQAGKDAIFAVRMDQREFNLQMSDYLKINPSLSDSLRNGAYSNKNTREVIHKFNTWYNQRKAAQGASTQP